MQQEEQTERKIYLISKAVNGTISEDELYELEEWKNSSPANGQLYGQLMDAEYRAQKLRDWDSKATEDELVRLNARMDSYQRNRRFSYAIAATILAALAAIGIISFVLTRNRHKVYTGPDVYKVASTIAPGSNRATLTLADGRTIDLSSAGNGNLAQQEGVTITKTANGQLAYTIAGQANAQNTSIPTHNTINTPKGGQYQVRLPDGTTVLLNAASGLKYPTTFSGAKQRQVELSGEAYFEVAHNKAQPFIVKTAAQQVEVLGTHFNISSYADDNHTITTLAQGSVRVSSADKQQILKPGQQSIAGNGTLTVQQADMEQALAWKNDEILFKSQPLTEILKQVARWYNVEIVYRGNLANEPITGGISRKDNLDVVLRLLELNGTGFTIEKDKTTTKLIIQK